MKRHILTIGLALCVLSVNAATTLSGRFRSISLPSGKTTAVFSMAQDPYGFIWMGTDDGLARYDGYGFKIYRWEMGDSLSLANNIVNALLYDSVRSCLYVGTDKGVCIYDSETDCFHMMPGTAGRHVKAFLSEGNDLYVATTTGLLKRMGNHTDTILEGHFTSIRKVRGSIWASSYGCIYDIGDGTEIHDLTGILKNKDVLVLDICEDITDSTALWLGTEKGLFHYRPAERKADRHHLPNTPVKTFRYSGRDLWIGSDNGLIVMGKNGDMDLFRHKVGESASIPNNVVWNIMEDLSGNIWLGTDHGVAVSDIGYPYKYIGVDMLTGLTEGLDVSVLKTDRDGYLWLGGRNGLIRSRPGHDDGIWLKADSGHGRLSHNKVRGLHDDGQNMWIISDGGLDIYRYDTGRIMHRHILEPTGRYNSNWMYSIAEDPYGRLWIGTYDGGMYGVDKERILTSKERVICDIHLNKNSVPALASNIVRNIAIHENDIYAETYNVINIISLETWETRRTPLPYDVFVLSMIPGGDCVWIGTDKGLFQIRRDGSLNKVSGSDVYVMSLAWQDDRIWVAGKTSISSYCPETGIWEHTPMNELTLMSVTPFGHKLYFGTVDGIIEYSSENRKASDQSRDITLTRMWVNDEPVEVGKKYDGHVILERNITLTDRITLAHSQNSFAFSMSSFAFGGEDDAMMYRLKGFDDKWRRIQDRENKAVFINVPSGDYIFEFAAAGSAPEPTGKVYSVGLHIKPVWYATPLAYFIYVILSMGVCIVAIHIWKMRHQLRMEHEERERAIAMADSKTEFLSDISHEFKSPLSIILSFVSRMTASESDALRTRELQTIQKNAEKMHLLLNQMVAFNENGSSNLFMPVAVSLGEIAKEAWGRFAMAFAEKDISARFVADDIGYMFMVDRVQMESVLQNLLSNALKFTPRGGSILMSVSISDETTDMVYADIKVEDTGCGISADELPKIFNRFYMGTSTKGMNQSGSGIGLHMVKRIVEMHKGRIMVSSEQGKGSCFTIRLSTMKADSFILKSAVESDPSLHNLSRVWQHDRKPIILIVEDNQDIRDFIIASLGKDYVFLTAQDGKSGLNILKKEKIDLVITDIAMPEMDGLTMSRSIRNNLHTAFLPIIILTGKNDAQTQMQSFEYADAFIAKPFDLNYLNGRIIQLLIKHEQYLNKMRQQNILQQQTESLESPDDLFLQEMTAIVSRHIDDSNFSVSVLCSESHWSDKQVYRKMKQLTGKTVSEFIREIRLEKAAAYLAQHKLTVNEVMYKVGFTTASYFSKCFKEKFGVSPSEYYQNY